MLVNKHSVPGERQGGGGERGEERNHDEQSDEQRVMMQHKVITSRLPFFAPPILRFAANPTLFLPLRSSPPLVSWSSSSSRIGK